MEGDCEIEVMWVKTQMALALPFRKLTGEGTFFPKYARMRLGSLERV